MPQALRKTYDQPHLEQVVEQSPKFQAYTDHQEEQAVQFGELIFFAQLFAFSILTVALSFLLLVNNVLAILAVPLAMVMGAGLVVAARTLMFKFF